MYKLILIRFGDLTLKGKNRNLFTDALYSDLKFKLKKFNLEIEKKFDRIYLHINPNDYIDIEKILLKIPGILNFSPAIKCESNLDIIKEEAVKLIKEEIKNETTFKIETKRSNKNFLLTSPEITKEVSSFVLKNISYLKVDVHNPNDTLNINVKDEYTYLYLKTIKAMNGYPQGVMGKGLVLLSGGIDSPVSSYLAIKQGIEVELIHFESTPLTSIESVQKVIDLAKKIASYSKHNKVKLHLIRFKEIHKNILDKVKPSYHINVMRRMMYRIADKIAIDNKILTLINGESVGQVASQTLESMNVVSSVCKTLILRPLITYDKNDIIKISKEIDCFDISIKPFEDCCTIYVPKNPVIKPKLEEAVNEENKFDYNKLIEEAIKESTTLIIDKDSNLDITLDGFEVYNIFKENNTF